MNNFDILDESEDVIYPNKLIKSDSFKISTTKFDMFLGFLVVMSLLISAIIAFEGNDFNPPLDTRQRIIIPLILIVIISIPISTYFFSRYLDRKTVIELYTDHVKIVQAKRDTQIPLYLIRHIVIHKSSNIPNYPTVKGLTMFHAKDEGEWTMELFLNRKIQYYLGIFKVNSSKVRIGPFKDDEMIEALKKEIQK